MIYNLMCIKQMICIINKTVTGEYYSTESNNKELVPQRALFTPSNKAKTHHTTE